MGDVQLMNTRTNMDKQTRYIIREILLLYVQCTVCARTVVMSNHFCKRPPRNLLPHHVTIHVTEAQTFARFRKPGPVLRVSWRSKRRSITGSMLAVSYGHRAALGRKLEETGGHLEMIENLEGINVTWSLMAPRNGTKECNDERCPVVPEVDMALF